MNDSSLRGGQSAFGLPIHLSGVVHIYPSAEGEVVALRGVDLDVAPGEAIALLGPSGAGKSTVLGLLAGDYPPSAGEVRIGDIDVGRASLDVLSRLRSRDVSIVVQGAARNLIG
jgi:putative ABC transport system ATP-binding protein